METSVVMSGFGGQGILLMGNLLAQAAMNNGKGVAYMPSYGVEMRGGAAMCTVVISDGAVGSPVVGRPDAIIVFTVPALKKYGHRVREGGILILNSGMVPPDLVERDDIDFIPVDFGLEAEKIDNPRGANMVALGVYLAKTNVVKPEDIEKAFPDVITERNHKFIPGNMAAIKHGMELANGIEN